jgi:alkanesulfonate monooxygenase SsuD/methylene tetrahydromethanopterin reductase-like flavin-dependent oxidoreductase (luciferase family)
MNESAVSITGQDEWAVERRELQTRARRAEKRLALMLISSALRRRKLLLVKHYFARWRRHTHDAFIATSVSFVRDDDDAQVLANELLRRLKALRGDFS